MIRLPTAALMSACLLAGPALADPNSCAGTTQADLSACAGGRAREADAALNTAYEALMHRIGPRAQDGLRKAQRAWLLYRDATCALEEQGSAGGSIQPMVFAQCLARVTDDRVQVLKGYLTCEEGDVSCVGRFQD